MGQYVLRKTRKKTVGWHCCSLTMAHANGSATALLLRIMRMPSWILVLFAQFRNFWRRSVSRAFCKLRKPKLCFTRSLRGLIRNGYDWRSHQSSRSFCVLRCQQASRWCIDLANDRRRGWSFFNGWPSFPRCERLHSTEPQNFHLRLAIHEEVFGSLPAPYLLIGFHRPHSTSYCFSKFSGHPWMFLVDTWILYYHQVP